MLIDWLTVAAQIVNFLILVGLMRRFLYGPLLHAIDAREEHVAAQLAEADRRTREAELKCAEVQTQVAGVQSRGEHMIEEARKEAERERTSMVAAARESVDTMQARWRDELRREEAVFFADIRHEVAGEVFSIARRALADLASTDIERAALETLLRKLGTMQAAELKKLCGDGLTVASAVELPSEARLRLQQLIESRIGGPVDMRFERAPEIAWGIELRGNGQRIGWTPDSYVHSLEEKLRSVVDAHV